MMYGLELKKCVVCADAPSKSKTNRSPSTVSRQGTLKNVSSNSVHDVTR